MAAPSNTLRVMAFGRNSSRAQREMARALALYVTGPLIQRNLTVESLSFLPVNPNVAIPINSSSALEVMVESMELALQSADQLTVLNKRLNPIQNSNDRMIELVFAGRTPQEVSEGLLSKLGGQP